MFNFNPHRLKEGSFKYLAAKESGYKDGDLPPFTVADVDFYLPKHITDELHHFITHTTHGYNAMSTDYYHAFSVWMKTHHNFEIKKEWLTLSTGVIPAIANALYAFTKENDAVCIMSPVYHVFYRIIDNLGRKSVINNLVLQDDNSYEIDFDMLEKQFIKEDVKVMLFCSPHNPIGKVWSKEDLIKLSNLCHKHDVLMIADEIHLDLILNDHKHIVYPTIHKEALNHTILCTAASKTFNLAGLKTSNIIIPNEALRKQYVNTLEKMTLGIDSPNTLGLYTTQVVYEKGDEYLEEFIKLIELNYKTIKETLSKHVPKIKVSPLEGTYLLWFDFRDLNLTHDELIKTLQNEGLYLSSGLDFGINGEGFMRMNIATPHKFIVEAMKRLQNIGG
ncbi:MAG TPA: MalY/PatB family protein [Erysipelothrix sp.]|nr:MalY/PatB family protein [Erysipelothrix sp.]